MNQVQLIITAQSPLALGRQKPGGSISEVEIYIPGPVIRGAIAATILQQAHQTIPQTRQEGDFQRLFLEDQAAIFTNAYPAIAQIGKDQFAVTTHDIRVLPATAVSSKTNPGFFSSQGHGVFDTLIDSFCAEAFQQPYEFTDPTALQEGTNTQVEPYSSFYSQVDGHYYSHKTSSRFLTRVGINRRRATAEDQVLYSIEVLNESFACNPKAATLDWQPVVFRSTVMVPQLDLAEALAEFINAHSHQFRVGGSVSRGLGQVVIGAEPVSTTNTVQTRIQSFNQALVTRWQLWSVFGSPQINALDQRTYFTLDLQADAILQDNWMRTTVISAEMLQQFANVQDDSLCLHTAYSSYDYRSGWNAAWGLMKDVELVTSRGAVYLFSTTKPELWYEALHSLEYQGVGDRRSEGFGQVRICHEFHWVFREQPA